MCHMWTIHKFPSQGLLKIYIASLDRFLVTLFRGYSFSQSSLIQTGKLHYSERTLWHSTQCLVHPSAPYISPILEPRAWFIFLKRCFIIRRYKCVLCMNMSGSLCWNRQHDGQTIHPTKNLISMNLFKIICVVTWAWFFLTSKVMEPIRGQTHYSECTLWHSTQC
jgi:hypothetical protein